MNQAEKTRCTDNKWVGTKQFIDKNRSSLGIISSLLEYLLNNYILNTINQYTVGWFQDSPNI
jgi:hypothetical protein